MDELVVLPPRSISATTEFALPSPPEMRNRMFENLAFEICLYFSLPLETSWYSTTRRLIYCACIADFVRTGRSQNYQVLTSFSLREVTK